MTIARAIATRCCWPPESWPGNLSAWSPSRTSRSASSTRRRASRLGHPAHPQAEPDVARAPTCAGRARSSGRPCRSRAVRAAGCRCAGRRARSRRSVRGSSPARQLSAVDLPQPDGPSRATNSPPRIVRSSPSSARTSPKPRLTPSRRSSEHPWSPARPRHSSFTFALPTSRSQWSNAATCAWAASDVSFGVRLDRARRTRAAPNSLDRPAGSRPAPCRASRLDRRAGVEVARRRRPGPAARGSSMNFMRSSVPRTAIGGRCPCGITT